MHYTKVYAIILLMFFFLVDSMTKHLMQHLYPVIWLDQAAQINDAGMSKFKNSFWYIQISIHIAAYCLIAIGALLIIVSFVLGVVCCRQVSNKKVSGESRDGQISLDL